MDRNEQSNERHGMDRRTFLGIVGVAGASLAGVAVAAEQAAREVLTIREVSAGEEVFAYITRIKGGFDQSLYQQVVGAANEFKEGDETIGVGAKDEATRQNARVLLANTKIKDLYEHPLLVDNLQKLIWKTTDTARFKGILHIIGERPGTIHHSYSVYITVVKGRRWTEKNIDHDITRLVCNIADTALPPRDAARETITIMREMVGRRVNGSRRLDHS